MVEAVLGTTDDATKSVSLVVSYAAPLLEDLRLAIRRDAEYPSRPLLHKRLAAIEGAARLLVRELTDVQMSVLLRDGYEGIENDVSLAIDLRDLGRRAARGWRRSPKTQGRGKLRPDPAAGPNALEYCALIVSIAWHMVEGKWPGKRRAKAHLLCEALWLEAGGVPHGGPAANPGTLLAWRKHLVSARQYRPPHAAGEIVMDLITKVMDEPPPKTTPATC